MKKNSIQGNCVVTDRALRLELDGQVYLEAAHPLFLPRFMGQPEPAAVETTVQAGSDGWMIHTRLASGPCAETEVTVRQHGRYFEIAPRARMRSEAVLASWPVFADEGQTRILVNQVVVAHSNVAGRMATGVFDTFRVAENESCVAFEYRMGCGVASWFFPIAPHYILGAYHHLLFLGLAEVENVSVWRLALRGRAVQRWELDYGSQLRVRAGEWVEGPRWLGFFMESDNALDPWEVYGALLAERGKISTSARRTPAWWRNLTYVTWGDQHVRSDGTRTGRYRETETNLSDTLVRQWTDLVARHQLPIKTITLDGYWARQIGDWEADPARFPDMRRLVDELHARGWKVLFWFCPFEAERTAPVFRDRPQLFLEATSDQQLVLENGQAPKARPQFDFTNPRAREILRETIRRLLVPEPGCYNGDGLKLDFYGSAPDAGKIKAFHDPAWGLGYRYIFKTHQLIYQWAKEFKPDSRIDGENGNPFFTDYQDTLRAWDWCEPDYTVYNDRVKMASVLCPGIPAMYDEHIHFRNLFKYTIRSAVARPLFFNVAIFHGDLHVLTEEDYRNWKKVLDVVAFLNSQARAVTPESLDAGHVYDADGRLIAEVADDDTSLVWAQDGRMHALLHNDSDRSAARGVVADRSEYGIGRGPVVFQAQIPPGGMARLDE